jgi:hypothetical protein
MHQSHGVEHRFLMLNRREGVMACWSESWSLRMSEGIVFIGIIDTCERASALVYDILWGVARVERDWLYDSKGSTSVIFFGEWLGLGGPCCMIFGEHKSEESQLS